MLFHLLKLWPDVSSCFRVDVLFPVGHLQSGAQAEADHLARTGPHYHLRPLHGLPVLLATPALYPPPDQTDPRGSTVGDWAPPTVMSPVHLRNLAVDFSGLLTGTDELTCRLMILSEQLESLKRTETFN